MSAPTPRALRPLVLAVALALGAGPSRAEPPPGPVPPPLHLLGTEATPAERATFVFLSDLGWRFEPDPAAADVVIRPGQPGWRKNKDEAWAAGDLVARVPPTPAGAARLRALLPQFVDGGATRLAYQYRVEHAGLVALNKLIDLVNVGRYKFPQLFFWDSPFFQFHPPPPQWTERGRVYMASPPRASQAIEAFYARGGLAECYSAQWLGIWAIQYELLGREAFDETFRPEELVVGRPADVKPTPVGQTMLPDRTYPFRALFLKPEELKQDAGAALARLGPRAFAGLTGIVRAQDESDVANQNMISVTMSNRAAETLRDRGGMAHVAELGRQMAKAHAGTRGLLRGGKAEAQAELTRVMADPALAEWIVYVHPFGAQPLGEMLLREVQDNNRPVYVLLYVHGREDLFYQRYRATHERRWLRGTGAPAPR